MSTRKSLRSRTKSRLTPGIQFAQIQMQSKMVDWIMETNPALIDFIILPTCGNRVGDWNYDYTIIVLFNN